FCSAHAESAGGTLVTKPLRFAGSTLTLNIDSRGDSRVELQDATGKPLAGFTLADCRPIQADEIDQRVLWKGGDLSSVAGQTVRLRFDLKSADLYSFQFHH